MNIIPNLVHPLHFMIKKEGGTERKRGRGSEGERE